MRLFLLAMVALAGCGVRREPKVSGSDMYELREQFPGMTEACRETIRYGGFEAWPRELDACFEMSPPRRWKGLWRNDFEGSQFCPEPATRCEFDSEKERIWLTAKKKPDQALYHVEFVGRRTKLPGLYGQGGMSKHEILVDRMLSIKLIERGPTEAEIVKEHDKCVAAGECAGLNDLKTDAWIKSGVAVE